MNIRRGRAWLGSLLLASSLMLISASVAVAAPTYDGTMAFPQINGPADAEEYSWEMELQDEQELRAIDDQHAALYHTADEHIMRTISAGLAHDANGTSVPTSLSVTGDNLITLTVHHRAGDPAAGGAPFDYPVSPGKGGGSRIEHGDPRFPPPEEQLQQSKSCHVPSVRGWSRRAAGKRLRSAGCNLGKVRGELSKTAKVFKQGVPNGTVLPAGSRVSIKLG